jgi:hypothetical protein
MIAQVRKSFVPVLGFVCPPPHALAGYLLFGMQRRAIGHRINKQLITLDSLPVEINHAILRPTRRSGNPLN